ncbi:MAG: RNA polymerase factor sigma-32 [Rhodospirillaceae bacterium]|nr:RNA polymerase factor sigma-32 [Rhodospirillaceae bacterium]
MPRYRADWSYAVTTNLHLDFYRNTNGIREFVQKARSYPLLTVSEERRFITLWQGSQDAEAGHRLVSSHLRLVISITNSFRRYGLSFEDLVSEGCIGLMQAVDRFDGNRECRLSTYAKWWIRAAIQEHIMRSWSLVRIGTTVAQKKLFFNLRRMKRELCGDGDGHLSEQDIETIMARLHIARRDVVAMEGRMSGMDISLNVPTSDGDASEKIDALADTSETPAAAYENHSEHGYQRRLLGQALECVSERDAEIFKARRFWEDTPTLKKLGADYGLSPERVRQIEHGVFKVVRDYVLTEAPEYGSQFG